MPVAAPARTIPDNGSEILYRFKATLISDEYRIVTGVREITERAIESSSHKGFLCFGEVFG